MEIFCIPEPFLALRSYIIGDSTTGKAVVIDPFPEPELYIEAAKRHGWVISAILETHVHADFISGALELKKTLPNQAIIYASAAGGKEWTPLYVDFPVKGGETIDLGTSQLEAFHAPGHTPEHLVWLLKEEGRPRVLFSGDLLLSGGVGRPDLLGQSAADILVPQLHRTLFDLLSIWPDDLVICAAHGAGSWCGQAGKNGSEKAYTTLGEERQNNPFLQALPFEEWKKRLLTGLSKAPPTVLHVKRRNVEREKVLNLPKQTSDLSGLVVDTRTVDEYTKGHWPLAINLPKGSLLGGFAPWVLPANCEISAIIGSSDDWEGIRQLQRLGFAIQNAFVWNSEAETAQLTMSDIHAIAKEQPYVLDVRRPEEWQAGHIPWAKHVELKQLSSEIATLPKNRPIHVICRTGQRASTAASMLLTNGYKDVANVKGGMQAWQQAGLPMSTT